MLDGVLAERKTQVGLQGRVISTSNPLDIAINGKGLFVLNTELDGTGEELYTRDGGFNIRVAGSSPYTLPDGTATTPVLAPRLKLSDVRNRALMIHAGGDNHADHPAPLGGGGGRVACGVIGA